jgi:hypothetical protein
MEKLQAVSVHLQSARTLEPPREPARVRPQVPTVVR